MKSPSNLGDWEDENVARFGEYDAAVVAGGTMWTSTMLRDHACRLTAALGEFGIAPGDRVMLLLPNCPELLVVSSAIWRSGAVVVLPYPGSPAAEIERLVAHCAPTALVTVPGVMQKVDKVTRTVRNRIVVGAVEDRLDWHDCAELIARHAPLARTVTRQNSDPVQISYSSGTTTGTPKGVVYTHGPTTALLERLARPDHHGWGSGRVDLVVMPASSSGGSALKMRLAVKKTVVLVDEFEPHTVLSAIDRYAVTDTMLVPSMCELLLDDPAISTHAFSSLRLVGLSGAPVSASLVERFRKAFGIHPSIFYGMAEGQYGFTETTSLSKPGSVGRTRSEIELQILDDEGQPLAPGSVGTICARSRYIAAGYYNAPEESAATFRDGWVRTGDLGYLDSDAELFLVGRRNQMIIQSGVNVYPDEIAGLLQRIPGVKDCAVVGVPDDVLGEAVVAAVIRASETSVTKEAVLARCQSELDPRKVPVDVIFVDILPRNPQGKIDVRALRQQLETITTNRRIELRSRVDCEAIPAPEDGASHVGPSTAEERMLATIWIEVLGVPRLGLHDDFFALGGNSLLAIRLVAEIVSAFGVRIPLRQVFESPTIGALAAVVRAACGKDQVSAGGARLSATGVRVARLTPPQRGTYRIDQGAPVNHMNRPSWSAFLDGPLDVLALERALAALRERHGILRTRFFDDNGELWQEILEPAAVTFPLLERLDLAVLPESERARAEDEFHERFARPFDLAAAEVMRATLVALSPTRHRITLSLHRIVCDDHALRVFTQELAELWRVFTEDSGRDTASVLAPVPLQYIDLADYLQRLAGSEAGRVQRSFWQERLAGAVPLELPTDQPRESVDARRDAKAGFVSFPVGFVSAQISRDRMITVQSVAKHERVSVHSTLLAAMAAYLSRQTGQRDLAIVSHLIYRHLPGLERAMGLFSNPLVMRVSAAGSPSFRELVARTHEAVTSAFENGECDVLGLASHRLFRLWFNYIARKPDTQEFTLSPGLTVAHAALPREKDPEIAYDLLLYVINLGDHVTLRLAYNRELFHEAGATALLFNYVDAVERLCGDPDGSISLR